MKQLGSSSSTAESRFKDPRQHSLALMQTCCLVRTSSNAAQHSTLFNSPTTCARFSTTHQAQSQTWGLKAGHARLGAGFQQDKCINYLGLQHRERRGAWQDASAVPSIASATQRQRPRESKRERGPLPHKGGENQHDKGEGCQGGHSVWRNRKLHPAQR